MIKAIFGLFNAIDLGYKLRKKYIKISRVYNTNIVNLLYKQNLITNFFFSQNYNDNGKVLIIELKYIYNKRFFYFLRKNGSKSLLKKIKGQQFYMNSLFLVSHSRYGLIFSKDCVSVSKNFYEKNFCSVFGELIFLNV